MEVGCVVGAEVEATHAHAILVIPNNGPDFESNISSLTRGRVQGVEDISIRWELEFLVR